MARLDKAQLEAMLEEARASTDSLRKKFQESQKELAKLRGDSKRFQQKAEAAEAETTLEKRKRIELLEVQKKYAEIIDDMRAEHDQRVATLVAGLKEKDEVIQAKNDAITKFTDSFDAFKTQVDARFADSAKMAEENAKLRCDLQVALKQLELKDELIEKQNGLYEKELELLESKLKVTDDNRQKLVNHAALHEERATKAIAIEEATRKQLKGYVDEFQGVKIAVEESHRGMDKLRNRLAAADRHNAKLTKELTEAKKRYIDVSEQLIATAKAKQEMEVVALKALKKSDTLEKLCRALKAGAEEETSTASDEPEEETTEEAPEEPAKE